MNVWQTLVDGIEVGGTFAAATIIEAIHIARDKAAAYGKIGVVAVTSA